MTGAKLPATRVPARKSVRPSKSRRSANKSFTAAKESSTTSISANWQLKKRPLFWCKMARHCHTYRRKRRAGRQNSAKIHKKMEKILYLHHPFQSRHPTLPPYHQSIQSDQSNKNKESVIFFVSFHQDDLPIFGPQPQPSRNLPKTNTLSVLSDISSKNQVAQIKNLTGAGTTSQFTDDIQLRVCTLAVEIAYAVV